MIFKLARKSFRARLGRNLFVLLAVALGVSFVAGSFVLADSMRDTFDELFDDVGDDVDFVVRPGTPDIETGSDEEIADDGGATTPMDGIPVDLANELINIDGVEYAEGDYSQQVIVVDDDNTPVRTGGAPMLALAYPNQPTEGLTNDSQLDGDAPNGPDEVVIDRSSADRYDYEIGSTVRVGTRQGLNMVTVTGILDSSTPEGGAVLLFFDLDAAGELLGRPDVYDSIRVDLADGADAEQVETAIADQLPAGTEVISGEAVAEENKDAIGQFITIFSTGLLIFAAITAFVSAFIINNVFTITLGQRLRELALLRAVGASKRQIRSLVLSEAALIALVGTIVGIFGGIVIAKLLVALFNAAGAELHDFGMVITVRTVIVCAIVGLGTVLVAAFIPARRAAKIPPVAAMRPELGFSALAASRRLIGGTIATIIGVVLFSIGIFVRPGGAWGIIALGGGGALMIFIGISSLSTAVARPVSLALGAPIQALAGVPGGFARQNAARSPRRTARTSSALMIGVAIVATAATFAASIKADLSRALATGITADYVVNDATFSFGVPPEAADEIAALPEVATAQPITFIDVQVDPSGVASDTPTLGVNPATATDVLGLDPTEGGYDRLAEGAIGVFKSNADDWGVEVGDTVTVATSGGTRELTVGMIFENNLFGPINVVSEDLLVELEPEPDDPFRVLIKTADGVSDEQARAAFEGVTNEFPQLEILNSAEQRAQWVGRIDQTLYIITALMGFAFALAFFGIAVTLAMSVLERTREIGLLRAVGMTRRQLRRAIRWESVIVAVFGVLVGAVVGMGLAIALLNSLPDGYIDVVAIPWSTLIVASIIAVIFALVAAWYPARKASRMDVLDALSAT